MNKVLIGMMLMISSMFAGTVITSVGIGKETVVKPRAISVDLVQAQLAYRFNSGIVTGVSIIDGMPDVGTRQTRTEINLGYTTKVGNLLPYIIAGKGNLEVGPKDYDYVVVMTGCNVMVAPDLSVSVQHRYRKDDDMNWKTNRYQLGAGYKLNKTTSVVIGYGKSYGTLGGNTYESIQQSIGIDYKF
jgi:hypothetical protein